MSPVRGYITPNTKPYGVRCRALSIPNSSEWESILIGALLELTRDYNFEQIDGLSSSEVSEVFQDALLGMLDGGCCRKDYYQRVLGLSSEISVYWRLDYVDGFYLLDSVTEVNTGFANNATADATGIGDKSFGLAVDTASQVQGLGPLAYGTFDGNLFTSLLWFRVSDLAMWTDSTEYVLIEVQKATDDYFKVSLSTVSNTIIVQRSVTGQTLMLSWEFDRQSDWWIPVAVVCDRSSSRFELYVAGVMVDSDSTALGEWVETEYFIGIGRSAEVGNARHFVGSLAHYAFWIGALSSDEVKTVHEVL